MSNIDELEENLKDEYNRLIMQVDTEISLSSVILSSENKDKIKQFIKQQSYKDKLEQAGLEPMNRILMYGASGTGKTYLSKALSNHLGYKMLYISIANALTDGNAARNVDAVFEIANKLHKCIIFLDECDSIMWNRDAKSSESGEIRRATSSMFQNLDQMDSSNIFISATNMIYRLDPAFERRFDLKMRFDTPDLDIKQVIKRFMLPYFRVKDNVGKEYADIIQMRLRNEEKLSYYGMKNCIENVMKEAVLNDTNIVETKKIYDELAKLYDIKLKGWE